MWHYVLYFLLGSSVMCSLNFLQRNNGSYLIMVKI